MANSNTSAQGVEESSRTHDTNPLTNPSSLNAFVGEATEKSFLQEFISSPGPTEEDVAGDISTLLKQLEMAEGVAQGVENKLDKLFENLEELLEDLEGTREVQPQDGTDKSDINLSSTTDPRTA